MDADYAEELIRINKLILKQMAELSGRISALSSFVTAIPGAETVPVPLIIELARKARPTPLFPNGESEDVQRSSDAALSELYSLAQACAEARKLDEDQS